MPSRWGLCLVLFVLLACSCLGQTDAKILLANLKQDIELINREVRGLRSEVELLRRENAQLRVAMDRTNRANKQGQEMLSYWNCKIDCRHWSLLSSKGESQRI